MLIALVAGAALLLAAIPPAGDADPATEASTVPTVAERLGYTADARLLMVHADDLGLSHDTNTASIEVLAAGVVRSASIMVPCPWFPEIAAWGRDHPDADLGLHLTYTSEWSGYRWGPRAASSSVPGLVDRLGFLHSTLAAVLRSASVAEIEAETRAQIELALAAGLTPTHLDSHMGVVYASSAYFTKVLELADEYRIPLGIYGYTQAQSRIAGDGPLYDERFLANMRQRGVPTFDAWYSMKGHPPEESEQRYLEMIRALKPGLSILVIHVAHDTPEIRAIAPTSYRQRLADLEVFTSPAIRHAITEQGIILATWHDLKPLWLEARAAGGISARPAASCLGR